MRAGHNFNITRSVQGFQTASDSSSLLPAKRARTESESPESPPAKKARTEDWQQASSTTESAFLHTGSWKRHALLKQFSENLESELAKEIQEKPESHSTKEIQEEAESHVTAEGTSTKQDFGPDLEEQKAIEMSAFSISGQALTHRRRTQPTMLDDLPQYRKFLFDSTNPAASILGDALEKLQTQSRSGEISPGGHENQCAQILKAAEMLHGLIETDDNFLRDFGLNGMTHINNALTEEEYSTITHDVELQRHPEQGVAAVRQRDIQNARAADRHRRALLNMTKVDADLAKTTTKGLYHICDAAASTLSYSAAALSNSSLYRRSMASGAAWTAAAAFNCISRTLSDQDRTVAGFLSDATDFGAGIASMAAAGLSHVSNPSQKAINYAATISNALWMSSGALSSAATIQSGRKVANQYGMSALAYAATGLGLAEDWANVAAAAVGVASTATSNGSNPTLNKLSSGLWMAGTVFGVASTILSKVNENRLKEMNHPMSN